MFVHQFHRIRIRSFPRLDRYQFIPARSHTRPASIDFLPTGKSQNPALGLEDILQCAMGNGRKPGRLLKLRIRIENGDESLHHHVVNFLLGIREFGDVAGGDDRKVIGNLFGIENPSRLVKVRTLAVFSGEHRVRIFRHLQITASDLPHRVPDVQHVIFGKIAGIRSRIGQHLVLFIERLGDLQGSLRGKRSLALEGREIIQLRRDLAAGFFLL